jgi:hypothetical protein
VTMFAGLSRRALLVGTACLVAARAGRAHTPYRQWEVYRRKHLLVGTCRADPESYPLGKRLVSMLVSGLPESKARITRAPDQKRLASLLTTDQLELVLFTVDEAVALDGGKAPFTDYGPYPLRLVFEVDGYALVCGETFPARHAWLVTETLAEHLPLPKSLLAAERLSLHEGTRAFLSGEPQPEG